jgi:hypothetical protein
MLYSPSTAGFYHPKIHGAGIPADAVEITDARHAELIAGQADGRIIVAGPDGAPVLVDPPPAPTRTPVLSRAQFCVALTRVPVPPIFTDAEALAALEAFPPKFMPALANKDLDYQAEAIQAWRTTATVARNSPLFEDLLHFYAAQTGLTAEQMVALGDEIFSGAT